MPSHPPDTKLYKADDTHKLWRDVSRLFEDFCGDDYGGYSDKQKKFAAVLKDVLARLENSDAR